jgi:hypothetical protein
MKIDDLRAEVRAADEEFHIALACYEAWKPAAYDKALHERIGRSLAANTFLVVRAALRRETLLALTRLWDKRKGTVRMMISIANGLDDSQILDALVVRSAVRFGDFEPYGADYITKAIRDDLSHSIEEAKTLIRKYREGGIGHSTMKKLMTIRHEHLAHRQIEPKAIKTSGEDILDNEIETFYQDTSMLIRLLLHIVEKTAYNPDEAAEVHAQYAALFWASVRSERTEGHPQYRAAPSTVTIPNT